MIGSMLNGDSCWLLMIPSGEPTINHSFMMVNDGFKDGFNGLTMVHDGW